jgi:hypothetical protein
MMKRMEHISLQDKVRQGEGTVVSEMDGEKVMLSIERGMYYNLGKIGGDIWGLMDKPVAVYQLVNQLTSVYEVDISECEAHVISFLEHLLKEELIRIGE